MSIFTEVVVPKSISELCEERHKIVAMVEGYYKTAQIADEHMKTVISWGAGINSYAMPKYTLEEAIKSVDKSFWFDAFEKTGFMQLLDAASRKKFDQDINSNPPEFSIKNIQATFLDLSMGADKMFNDGIINVFRALSGNYESHNAFRIDRKIILQYSMQPAWSGGMQFRYGTGDDRVNDIDRVIKTLDGKKHNPRELSCAMMERFKLKEAYEDAYYKAKAFKNGNLHIEFKRSDLVDRINLIIAKHYGDTLPRGK